MANLSSAINVNVDAQLKEEATNILKDLGLNDANPKPSQELLEAIQEGEDILSGKIKAKSYTNMYEMLEDLKE